MVKKAVVPAGTIEGTALEVMKLYEKRTKEVDTVNSDFDFGDKTGMPIFDLKMNRMGRFELKDNDKVKYDDMRIILLAFRPAISLWGNKDISPLHDGVCFVSATTKFNDVVEALDLPLVLKDHPDLDGKTPRELGYTEKSIKSGGFIKFINVDDQNIYELRVSATGFNEATKYGGYIKGQLFDNQYPKLNSVVTKLSATIAKRKDFQWVIPVFEYLGDINTFQLNG